MKLTVQHLDGLRFLVTAGEHSLIVDAPIDEGGSGTAMNSRQLFVASLAACAMSFVANSLRLRGLAWETLSLETAYEEERRPQRISHLDMHIHVEPELPEKRRRAVLGVAQHSTLFNTLARAPEVRVHLE